MLRWKEPDGESRRTRLPRVGVSLLAVLLALPSCRFKGDQADGSGGDGRGSPGVGWRITPDRIRVYPASRFVKEPQTHLLEARVEVFDALGDSMKASGRYQFELFLLTPASGSPSTRPLYIWQREVLTKDAHRKHYDPVTRTYRFRLGVDDARAATHRTLLRVDFTPLDGGRLVAESVIGADPLIERHTTPTR